MRRTSLGEPLIKSESRPLHANLQAWHLCSLVFTIADSVCSKTPRRQSFERASRAIMGARPREAA